MSEPTGEGQSTEFLTELLRRIERMIDEENKIDREIARLEAERLQVERLLAAYVAVLDHQQREQEQGGKGQ